MQTKTLLRRTKFAHRNIENIFNTRHMWIIMWITWNCIALLQIERKSTSHFLSPYNVMQFYKNWIISEFSSSGYRKSCKMKKLRISGKQNFCLPIVYTKFNESNSTLHYKSQSFLFLFTTAALGPFSIFGKQFCHSIKLLTAGVCKNDTDPLKCTSISEGAMVASWCV